MKPLRVFALLRDEDESGVSGVGHVADGVVFPNGWVALDWRTQHTSMAFYPSMNEVVGIHGHGGKTRIAWAGDCSAALRFSGQSLPCFGTEGHSGLHGNADTGVNWDDSVAGAIPHYPVPHGGKPASVAP